MASGINNCFVFYDLASLAKMYYGHVRGCLLLCQGHSCGGCVVTDIILTCPGLFVVVTEPFFWWLCSYKYYIDMSWVVCCCDRAILAVVV